MFAKKKERSKEKAEPLQQRLERLRVEYEELRKDHEKLKNKHEAVFTALETVKRNSREVEQRQKSNAALRAELAKSYRLEQEILLKKASGDERVLRLQNALAACSERLAESQTEKLKEQHQLTLLTPQPAFAGSRLESPSPTPSPTKTENSMGSMFSGLSKVTLQKQRSEAVAELANVHHAGWLLKKSHGRYTSRWQKRYFVLDGAWLHYQHSNNPKDVQRKFDIRRARLNLGGASGNARELILSYPNEQDWHLKADAPEDARRWISELDSARAIADQAATTEDSICLDDSQERVAAGFWPPHSESHPDQEADQARGDEEQDEDAQSNDRAEGEEPGDAVTVLPPQPDDWSAGLATERVHAAELQSEVSQLQEWQAMVQLKQIECAEAEEAFLAERQALEALEAEQMLRAKLHEMERSRFARWEASNGIIDKAAEALRQLKQEEGSLEAATAEQKRLASRLEQMTQAHLVKEPHPAEAASLTPVEDVEEAFLTDWRSQIRAGCELRRLWANESLRTENAALESEMLEMALLLSKLQAAVVKYTAKAKAGPLGAQ